MIIARKHIRSFITCLVSIFFLCSLTSAPAWSQTSKVAAATQVSLYRVNINQADAESLSTNLTGVGSKRAQAIIAYRDKNGPFRGPEDLLAIRGIGQSFLDKNKDRMEF